jgi:hypothetical protein
MSWILEAGMLTGNCAFVSRVGTRGNSGLLCFADPAITGTVLVSNDISQMNRTGDR